MVQDLIKQNSRGTILWCFKMNIDTDTNLLLQMRLENRKAFKYQIDPDDGTPYKKQYDLSSSISRESMVKRLDEAFSDLGFV